MNKRQYAVKAENLFASFNYLENNMEREELNFYLYAFCASLKANRFTQSIILFFFLIGLFLDSTTINNRNFSPTNLITFLHCNV